jgi:dephospho-CoA kinase
MLIIGLTGGIGSGKTTVSNIFSNLDVPIIDTDIIARELVKPGQAALDEIINTFGHSILKQNKTLDRGKLAEITFSNEFSKKQLEDILHPRIRKTMHDRIKELSAPYCIVVIPLLFETEQSAQVDRVLLVDSSVEEQITRVKSRDHRSEQQITSIINSQTDRKTKQQNSDDIINNNGDINDLEKKIKNLHNNYLNIASTHI